MVVVSYDEMCRALEVALGRRGMGAEEISNLAEYVLNFFGFADRIIDNILQPNDRDIFYMLEEEGFLKTESTEVAIAKPSLARIPAEYVLMGASMKSPRSAYSTMCGSRASMSRWSGGGWRTHARRRSH